MTPINTLDVFLIVASVFVVGIGTYLMVILHRVAHITKVADRVAYTVERFQDILSVVDRIPTEIIKKVTDVMPGHKKK